MRSETSGVAFANALTNSRKAPAQFLLLDIESEHCGFPRRSPIQVLTRLMLLNFNISGTGILPFCYWEKHNSFKHCALDYEIFVLCFHWTTSSSCFFWFVLSNCLKQFDRFAFENEYRTQIGTNLGRLELVSVPPHYKH